MTILVILVCLSLFLISDAGTIKGRSDLREAVQVWLTIYDLLVIAKVKVKNCGMQFKFYSVSNISWIMNFIQITSRINEKFT